MLLRFESCDSLVRPVIFGDKSLFRSLLFLSTEMSMLIIGSTPFIIHVPNNFGFFIYLWVVVKAYTLVTLMAAVMIVWVVGILCCRWSYGCPRSFEFLFLFLYLLFYSLVILLCIIGLYTGISCPYFLQCNSFVYHFAKQCIFLVSNIYTLPPSLFS